MLEEQKNMFEAVQSECGDTNVSGDSVLIAGGLWQLPVTSLGSIMDEIMCKLAGMKTQSRIAAECWQLMWGIIDLCEV